MGVGSRSRVRRAVPRRPEPAATPLRRRVAKGDIEILVAAQIAEGLAVTTYTNIIEVAPFFARLASDDQGYLKAARQEEMVDVIDATTADRRVIRRFSACR
jgi:hypothetical protein